MSLRPTQAIIEDHISKNKMRPCQGQKSQIVNLTQQCQANHFQVPASVTLNRDSSPPKHPFSICKISLKPSALTSPVFSMVTTEIYPTQNHLCTTLMLLSRDAWFLLACSCGFGLQGSEFLSHHAAGSMLPSQTQWGWGATEWRGSGNNQFAFPKGRSSLLSYFKPN